MPFIHLAQATDIPDAEVVEQAVRVIDTFSSLGPFMAVMAVITLAFLVILVVVFSGRNSGNVAMSTLARVSADKEKENEALKEEKREDKLWQRQYQEQFLAMIAAVSGKQVEGTAAIIKSGVDSESRVSSQITSAENNIKGRVAASADANTAAFEKVYKLMDNAFKIALARPPDPLANDKYDQALAILTAQMEQVKGDLEGVKGDVATNTDARVTSEMAAVEVPPAVTLPPEVVIADINPAALETIKGAMMPTGDAGAATEGGEGSEDKVA